MASNSRPGCPYGRGGCAMTALTDPTRSPEIMHGRPTLAVSQSLLASRLVQQARAELGFQAETVQAWHPETGRTTRRADEGSDPTSSAPPAGQAPAKSMIEGVQPTEDSPPPPPREGRPSRRVRCRDRAVQWQSDMHRAATQLMVACPADSDAIVAHLEREIEGGPDFTRCHRGSDFRSPPKVNTDRNVIAKIYASARAIENRSHTKGKHGGTLGKAALELLRVFLYVVNKSGGYLCPDYDTLAKLTGYCRRTIATGIRMLQLMGFITVHRRIKRVHTAFGPKVVQDSNAYEYHLPTKGLGALARAFFRLPSECNSRTARNVRCEKKEAYRGGAQVEAVIVPF